VTLCLKFSCNQFILSMSTMVATYEYLSLIKNPYAFLFQIHLYRHFINTSFFLVSSLLILFYYICFSVLSSIHFFLTLFFIMHLVFSLFMCNCVFFFCFYQAYCSLLVFFSFHIFFLDYLYFLYIYHINIFTLFVKQI